MPTIDHKFLESLMMKSHPFDNLIEGNLKNTLANFFAMSQSFPYIQSGTQKKLYDHYIDNNIQIDKPLEITTVVANFLSWDETGGLYVTLRKKMAGISDILQTDKYFHSNYLRDDLVTLFGHAITPLYSDVTKNYLNNLYLNLSNIDAVKRCATMVSFEEHANQMILSLWNSLSGIFTNIEKNDLKYFYGHVGGDDPAESYHVKMTEEMISILADTSEKQNTFIEHFRKCIHCISNGARI